jgi:hypothetical protein
MSIHARVACALCTLAIALLSTGCYSLTIVSGRQPAPSPAIEDKWRSAAAVDVVQIDTPIDFETTCKDTGWAKVHQVFTPVDWFADFVLAGFWLYESTHVDVYCAKRGAAPPPPPPGTPNQPPGTPNQPPGTPTQPPGTPTQPPLPPSTPPPGSGDRAL